MALIWTIIFQYWFVVSDLLKRSFSFLVIRVQRTKVTDDADLLTSLDQALQRDVCRAEGSSDRGALDQVWYRLSLFVFRFVFGGSCRLERTAGHVQLEESYRPQQEA